METVPKRKGKGKGKGKMSSQERKDLKILLEIPFELPNSAEELYQDRLHNVQKNYIRIGYIICRRIISG